MSRGFPEACGTLPLRTLQLCLDASTPSWACNTYRCCGGYDEEVYRIASGHAIPEAFINLMCSGMSGWRILTVRLFVLLLHSRMAQ